MIRQGDEVVGIESVHGSQAHVAARTVATPCACVFLEQGAVLGQLVEDAHLLRELVLGILIVVAVHLGYLQFHGIVVFLVDNGQVDLEGGLHAIYRRQSLSEFLLSGVGVAVVFERVVNRLHASGSVVLHIECQRVLDARCTEIGCCAGKHRGGILGRTVEEHLHGGAALVAHVGPTAVAARCVHEESALMQLCGDAHRTAVGVVHLVHLERVAHVHALVGDGVWLVQCHLYPSLSHLHILREDVGLVHLLAVYHLKRQLLREPHLQSRQIPHRVDRHTHGGDGHAHEVLVVDADCHIIVLFERSAHIASASCDAEASVE